MGIIRSLPITISINSQSNFVPPYNLPAVGQVTAIGLNSAYDITPPNMDASMWSYSLFNSWSCGSMVEEYSPGGAWVIANSGGHGAPANIGAAIFDFTDAKWKRLDPQGGQYMNGDFNTTDTSGAPFYEINGSNGVPSPSHTYQTHCVIPKIWNNGFSGIILVTRGAICNQSVISTAAHRLELRGNTCQWVRASNNIAPRASHDSSAVLDFQRKRWWVLTNNQNAYQNHLYLDANDWAFKLTESYPYPPGPMEAGRIWMHQGFLFRQSTDGKLYAWNPDNASTGWMPMNISGGALPFNMDSFAYYPPTGKFYHCTDSAGSTLVRLSPPSNLLSGTWVLDTVNLATALPARTVDGGPDPYHTNSLFYVPSIKRMAWVPGGGGKVYLLNPA